MLEELKLSIKTSGNQSIHFGQELKLDIFSHKNIFLDCTLPTPLCNTLM